MENEVDLQAQIQAIIDGKSVGEEARAVLCEALMQMYKLEAEVGTYRHMIGSAERALVYGAGLFKRPRPPIDKALVPAWSNNPAPITHHYQSENAARVTAVERLLPDLPIRKR